MPLSKSLSHVIRSVMMRSDAFFLCASSLQYHIPDIMTGYNHQLHYIDTGVTNPSSNAERQENY